MNCFFVGVFALLAIFSGARGESVDVLFVNHIVLFKEYLQSSLRHRILLENLHFNVSSSFWKIKARPAASNEFPSDFDVISIRDEFTESIRQLLLASPRIKGVFVDREQTRHLKHFQDDSLDTLCTRRTTKWSWENEV